MCSTVTAHSRSLAAEDLGEGEHLTRIFSVGFFQDLLPTPFPSAGMQQPAAALRQAGNNTAMPPSNCSASYPNFSSHLFPDSATGLRQLKNLYERLPFLLPVSYVESFEITVQRHHCSTNNLITRVKSANKLLAEFNSFGYLSAISR